MIETYNTSPLTSSLSCDNDRADSLRPKEFNCFCPYHLECLLLPVTVWFPRLHYYLKGVLVMSSESTTTVIITRNQGYDSISVLYQSTD
jgi:hypothetical protein